MGDYGLILRSAFGTMALHGDSIIYKLADSGQVVWNSITPRDKVVSFTSNFTVPPVVAMRIQEKKAWGFSYKGLIASGAEWSGFNVYNSSSTLPSATYNATVDWVAFIPVEASDEISGGYGMNIYNSSGDIVWSSDVGSILQFRHVNWPQTGPYPPGWGGGWGAAPTYTWYDETYPTTDYYFIRGIYYDADTNPITWVLTVTKS